MNTEDFLAAADTARVQSGGRSMLDKIGDAATAGTAGAVVSALGSIYNTGAEVANLFGADIQKADTAQILGNVDQNWAQYYKDNANVIDTVGFIGGSFIPGGLALKGLQLARAGKAAGAFGTVLRYTQVQQEAALTRGLQEVAQAGGSVFARLNANKLTSMAFGVADNVLQTAVFETAAAATMHASPFFANDSFGDIVWDITKTSLTGGLLGGGVEALFTNRIFRDAGKSVEKVSRKYDSVVTLDKMGMNTADQTFNLMDELARLPKEVLQDDKLVPFKYSLNGKKVNVDLDVSGLLDKKLQQTTQRVMDNVQTKLLTLSGNDVEIAKPVANALLTVLKKGGTQEVGDALSRQKLGDFLFGLKEMQPVGEATNVLDQIRYLSPKALITGESDQLAMLGPKRLTMDDKAFRIAGDESQAKFGIVGTDGANVKMVHDAGFDVAITPKGEIRINPDSQVYRPMTTADQEFAARSILNTRSLTTSDSSIPTVGDIATKDKPLQLTGNSVEAGGRTFEMSLTNYDSAATSVEATARHLWASKLPLIEKTVIDSHDFSLLDRIVADSRVVGKDVQVKLQDGSLNTIEELGNFPSWVLNQKVEYARSTYADALPAGRTIDPRDVAYKINSEHSWIEDMVAHSFDNTQLLSKDAFRPLESYAARENVGMIYDQAIKDNLMRGDFPTGQIAYEYRKTVAVQKAQEAAAAVLRDDYERLIDFNGDTLRGKFDATGVGATGVGTSNADYGDLGRLWAQDVGKTVSLISQRRVNSALDRIQPSASALITNPIDGAELAAVLTKVRRSQEPLSLFNGNLVDLASKKKMLAALQKGDQAAAGAVNFATQIPLSERVSTFLQAHHDLHQRQLDDRVTLANAQGTTLHWDRDALYLPPIDTKKVPYFAFVREAEGKAFSTSEVAMITARTPDELQRLASSVGTDFQVIYKGDTEAYHKALGDYDYTRALNRPTLDPFLRKKGVLGDFLPSLDPKAAVEDFVQYHTRKEQQLTRDAVEVKYAQTFNELNWLSDQSTKVEKSRFGFIGSLTQKSLSDPFGDYAKTALNISKRSEFTLWHQANEFVDALGTRAYRAVEQAQQSARAGDITWTEGNALMEKMGLGQPFQSQEAFLTAQVGNDRNLIKTAVAKGNMLLSTVGLRLDFANSLLNIVSTPIMLGTELSSIRTAVKGDSELAGKLTALTTLRDPGTGVPIPSTVKLIANAVKNYWTPEGKELISGRYKDIGAIKDILSQHHAMMDDLSLVPNMVPKKWAEKVESWSEKAATFTGNNFAEQFTRFVSADVMRQLSDPLVAAGRMSAKEQDAYISVFVNRVQGNYVASQRPIIFQGTIGAAVGLFQTYQFNLFQQLFRHIENRDARSIAVMGGLQSSIFGLNGLPFFDAINTHLIGQANINEGHTDAYSFAVRAAGPDIANWALYGTASAFPIFTDKMPALYTRGDINPRHVTVIPTSFDQIPAVDAGSRVVGSLLGMAKQIGNGNTAAGTLLFGLEHNGISRPLAGIAQSIQGYTTTGGASLISTSSDFNAIATASRILGAKPMDEAIALNSKFRLDGYRAADKARQEELGTVVRQRIRDGSLTEEDVNDFQGRYAQLGGRVDGFGAAMQRWTKGATQSVVNTLANSQKTAYGQRMNEIMGGERLEDYTTAPQPQGGQAPAQ